MSAHGLSWAFSISGMFHWRSSSTGSACTIVGDMHKTGTTRSQLYYDNATNSRFEATYIDGFLDTVSGPICVPQDRWMSLILERDENRRLEVRVIFASKVLP